MVLGKRPDPLEQLALTAGRRPVLGRQQAVLVPPPDRHRLGSAGQHLRLRRLRRLARREVRQERPLHQVGRHARQRAAAVQHAARDCGRRQGHGLRRRSRQLAHRRARQRSEPEGGLRQRRRAVGGLHLAADRTSISTARTRSRPATTSTRPPTTGEVYKMELDGTVLGRFGKAGHGFKEFSSIHQMDCRNPDELYVAEITAWRVQKILLRPQQTRTVERTARRAAMKRNALQFFAAAAARRAPAPRSFAQSVAGDRLRRERRLPDAACRRYSAKSPAWRPTRRATSSSTRAPATRSPRSATSGPSITAARACFSSIRPASS